MEKTESARTKRLKLRHSTIQYAEECDKKSAEGISPRKVPFRKILAKMAGAQVKLRLHGMDESDKAHLRECAILAMQDHAIRFEEYREGLRFIKVLEAVASKEVKGYVYTITFLGACDGYGKTTYKAVVFDGIVQRQVDRVWTDTPFEDHSYTGILCIPLSITVDIAVSSDVIPSEILAIIGDDDKPVLEDTPKDTILNKEATLIDCAILAFQDHAIQNDYFCGLRLIKLLNYRSLFADGYVYSITFRGASDKYGEVTYEADLWEDNSERKVGRVRTTSPLDKWYTGILCIPKIACKPE